MPKAIEGAHEVILSTTRTVLQRDGYDALTIRSIASEAGLATGTIYNYYKAKDELVYAVIMEDWERVLAEMDAVSGPGDPDPELEIAVRLKPIFAALSRFTAAYSSIWQRMAMVPKEERSPRVSCYDRRQFVSEISDRVAGVLESGLLRERTVPLTGEERKQLVFEAGLVSRLFGFYSMEQDFDYSCLEAVFRKLFR